MRILICSLTLLLTLTLVQGQTQFHMRYGSSYYDRARKVIQTQDGNFIVVGQTNGFGSAGNAFIMKVASTGSILWVKDYSGINVDEMRDLIELPDKKLVMCGSTSSYGVGGPDAFVMKTDSLGNLIWARAYGDIWGEYFLKISEDGTSGFYVAGYAQDASTTEGTAILRIDSSGNILWAKWMPNWSALGDWWPIDMTPIASGGVAVCGYGTSSNGIAVWKFSAGGSLVWSNEFAPSPAGSGLVGFSIIENNSGELLLNYAFTNINTVAQSVDNCIIKLNSSGTFISNKCYGGTYTDWCRTISNTSDGGTIMCGSTNSAGNGDSDASLIKLSSSGAVQWAKAYGTPWTENTANAIQTSDGGYILTGQTWSVGFDNDSSKVHLVKTDSLGNSSCNDISWSPVLTTQSVSTVGATTPIAFSFPGDNPINWSLNNRYFYTADICNPSSVQTIFASADSWSIYPNPFSTQTMLQTDNFFHNASLTIDNYLGQTVKEIKNISGQSIILQRDNLPSGLYFVRLTQDGKAITTKKIIITD